MSIVLFDEWKKDHILAGYTTDYEGQFAYCKEEDMPHYDGVAKQFGLDASHMIRLHQKHTDHILIATEKNSGDGVVREGTEEAFDGIVTDTKDLMACVVTADCVPVFLADRKKKVVGMVHSGRRGTAKEIVRVAIQKMVCEYHSSPEEIECILGPYLSRKHHEVGPECVEEFLEKYSQQEIGRFIQKQGDRFFVDMGEAIRLSLSKEKILKRNIRDCGICTFETTELYSWRRDHSPTARILSFVSIEKKA